MKKLDLMTLKTERGKQVLRQPAQAVTVFGKDLKKIIQEMKKLMVAQNGVGLAANQIGLDLAVFIARPKETFYVFINPEIELLGQEELKEEGCLSLPGQWGMVRRYNKVKSKYQDLNGRWRKMVARDLLAHIIQHEIDHLAGILFIDKATEVYTAQAKSK